LDEKILDIRYQESSDLFWMLNAKGLYKFNPKTNVNLLVYKGDQLTSFDIQGNNAVIGSPKGYFLVDLTSGKASGLNQKLPVIDITAVRVIADRIWFGSSNGAFATRKDGKYDYYQGERWLPGNEVKSINPGPGNSILMVTNGGLDL
jgi:ligand-binding sensor domain-containing protein